MWGGGWQPPTLTRIPTASDICRRMCTPTLLVMGFLGGLHTTSGMGSSGRILKGRRRGLSHWILEGKCMISMAPMQGCNFGCVSNAERRNGATSSRVLCAVCTLLLKHSTLTTRYTTHSLHNAHNTVPPLPHVRRHGLVLTQQPRVSALFGLLEPSHLRLHL